jgi:hypothetical protein
LQNSQNGFDYSACVGKRFIVPKSNYPPTPIFEPSCAARVSQTVGMLTTVDLNDQSMLGTGEVDDVISDRVLSPEFIPHQPPIAQC